MRKDKGKHFRIFTEEGVDWGGRWDNSMAPVMTALRSVWSYINFQLIKQAQKLSMVIISISQWGFNSW